MRLSAIFAISLNLFLALSIQAFSSENDDLKNTLFSGVKTQIEEARSMKADLLSPETFSQGEKAYNQALDAYNGGKNVDKIKKDIESAKSLIKKATDNVELSKLTLGKLIAAREDAIKASAPQYALDYFKEGEDRFLKAAKNVENGNVTKARKLADEAEPLFRQAESRAIKEGLMGEVRKQEKLAQERDAKSYSPKLLKSADKKRRDAEKFIDSQNYAIDTAKKKVEEARYDFDHSIQISEKVRNARKEKMSFEDIYLESEKSIEAISNILGVTVSFDKGEDYQQKQVMAAIERNNKDREELNQKLAKTVAENDNRVAELNQQITDKDKEIASLRGKNATEAEGMNTLKQKLEKENQAKEHYDSIRNLFTQKDGQVLKDGSDIILQLYGLAFQSGKSNIDIENYDLLAKVQKSLREFPQARVIIEGHTDSVGDKKQNEILSAERAKSVLKYLVVNNALEEKNTTSIGYGDAKPVASNKTPEGRMKNRRIDIIIKTE